MGHQAWGKSVATSEQLGSHAVHELVNLLLWKQEPTCGGLSPRDTARAKELRNACVNGELIEVQRLLDEGADATSKGQSGHTCLHLAALHGEVDVLHYLVAERKTDPNLIDDTGASPLHWACYSGNMKMITTLLACGAHVNVEEVHGCQPLLLTAVYGHRPAMLALLKAGANVHAVDHLGRTALIMAASRGHMDEVQLLLLHGSDPLHEDASGFNSTEHARMGKHKAVLQVLRRSSLVKKISAIGAVQNADRFRATSFKHRKMNSPTLGHSDQDHDARVDSQSELYMHLNREVVGGMFEQLMDFKTNLDNSLQAPVVEPPVVEPPCRSKSLPASAEFPRRARSNSLHIPENLEI
eukprot:CAMPEP_0114252342 /NCGR_PEP_ID=MMETSP0058-20121206/15781_1 /TAXON_ID=36894 /ORGANISM="Pyramimonas parkeae, CCMP726" /LENGTH=353 /DNA_ID=CAMNT_0001366261 /DNA_START=154 /DNA_END=1215 /DNA_ORIENTATION=-